MRKLFVLSIGAMLLAQLGGCGMARMAYSNGETLSYFWLDRYVDFNDEQRPWVKKEIAGLFEWHRQTQLPDYIELLKSGQQKIQRPLNETEMHADYLQIKNRILIIVDRSLPALADLALSLRPEQIGHLEKKFASNNDDYRRDNLQGDIEHRQRERYKKTLKQMEYFFGDFSNQQELQLRALSDARPLDNELVLKDRIHRQKSMVALLKKIQSEKPSREATTGMLKAYVDKALNHFGNAERKAYFEAYEKATVRQATEIMNGTTSAQKQHFIRNLQHWIDDFRALQGPANVGRQAS